LSSADNTSVGLAVDACLALANPWATWYRIASHRKEPSSSPAPPAEHNRTDCLPARGQAAQKQT